MENSLFESVRALVNEYNGKLALYGAAVSANRRYFENNLIASAHNYGNIFNIIESVILQRREKKYFNGVRNRYKVLVLEVKPVSKNKGDFKQYAFYVEKTERSSDGYKRKNKKYSDERVIKSVKKRLDKILNKAQKKSAEKLCRNTVADYLRYIFGVQYGYMKKKTRL